MDRFFKVRLFDISMCSLLDVVLLLNFSYVSKNIFSDEERKFFFRVCGGMVRGGIIFKLVVK